MLGDLRKNSTTAIWGLPQCSLMLLAKLLAQHELSNCAFRLHLVGPLSLHVSCYRGKVGPYSVFMSPVSAYPSLGDTVQILRLNLDHVAEEVRCLLGSVYTIPSSSWPPRKVSHKPLPGL